MKIVEDKLLFPKYAITADVTTNWDDEQHYNYRYHSHDGSPVAQDEFDRRRAANEPVVLWRWDHPNRPVLVDRYNA